ncbi:MAG: glu/Leu/Phe/Val dehydrogenase, dimerization region [Osedax symbiont Rs1]|nr:MAG: glu/Leu/Phe/Val dehydrogenase, dimerization region [Osedax symbiont Rs1]
MSVFSHLEFDNHQQVVFISDEAVGLKAIIAVHNTNLGPSLGGCRMWPYASDSDAIADVLRLSKGMTYKSAIAGLPLGGGKCVIIGDHRRQKTPQLLRALGQQIENLSGSYITAEDSGTCVADMQIISQTTQYVSGVQENTLHKGDPSPSTALGVFVGIKAAIHYQLNTLDLSGLTIAVQGIGNVGFHLCQYLKAAGANLIVADIFADNVNRAVSQLGAKAVPSNEIYSVDADVFAPCAMGGSLNIESLSKMRATVIAGAANNQLARPEVAKLLQQKGILYAPDYVINAGGILDIAYQRSGASLAALNTHIERIGDTLTEIFVRAEQSNTSTDLVANQLAEEIFQRPDLQTTNSTNNITINL